MSKPAPEQPLTHFVGVKAVLKSDGFYSAELEFLSTEGRALPVRIEFDVYSAELPVEISYAEYRHSDDSEATEGALALVSRCHNAIRLELEQALVGVRARLPRSA